jgi:hypothetical protein
MTAAEVSAADRDAGVTASGRQQGRDLRVILQSAQTREVEWTIRFGEAESAAR